MFLLLKIEYGFDGFLYCDCGAVRVNEALFRCAHPKHGESFDCYPSEAVVKDVCGNLKSFNGQTILVLGETGVGKSTFINAFANYMQFKTMVCNLHFIPDTMAYPYEAKMTLLGNPFFLGRSKKVRGAIKPCQGKVLHVG